MKDLALQKPFLQTIETTSPQAKNYYAMRKLIGDYLTKLNVASYDTCCAPSENTSWPTRWSTEEDRLERFDGTGWVEVTTGSELPVFFLGSVPFGDGSGGLTQDVSFTYSPALKKLFVDSIGISIGGGNDTQTLTIGNSAGAGLTVGATYHTLLGYNAGSAITTGDYNVAVGWNSLAETYNSYTNHTNLVAIGQQAARKCGTTNMIAIGAAAAANKGGNQNSIFIGVIAGYEASTQNNNGAYGDANIGIGYASLYNITSNGAAGRNNTAMGLFSGTKLTTGSNNTLLGAGVGWFGTASIGSNNTAVGGNAMLNFNDNSNNTAIGWGSLSNLQNGANSNIGLGYSAGSSITTGSYNVIIGSNNGASVATSSNNILIADGQGNLKLTIDSAHIFTLTNGLQEFADDTAASGGGIPVGGLYRTGSVVKIRVV